MGNNRGVILIMVLIIMTVAVAGVMAVEDMASKNFDCSQSVFRETQSALYFHSAIRLAKALLKNDNNDYDSFRDAWAKLPPFRTQNALIRVKIFPVNEKVNINLLSSGVFSRRIKGYLKRVVGVDYEKYIHCIDNWFHYRRGEYAALYHPTGGAFFSLKELDYVKGLGSFSGKFHGFFTVDGTSGKININFASEPVMKAYLPEIAGCVGEIIRYRRRKPFENITQLRNVDCMDDESYLKIQPFVTTQSNLFAERIDLEMDGKHMNAEVLLIRDGKDVKVVKYFEGKGFYE